MYLQLKNHIVSDLNTILRSHIFTFPMLFLFIFIPLYWTLPDYGITSDESTYQEAAWNIKKWLNLDNRKKLDLEEIDKYWKTDPSCNVHPSGVKWLYLAAQKIIFWEHDPYKQNSIMGMSIFSFSLIIFLFWWSGDSNKRKVIFIILLLTIPRFFAHVHFPATDIPMTSLLLLFIVSMDKTTLKSSFWISGVILGIFASIKITSGLLAFPIIIISYFHHRYSGGKIASRIILIIITSLIVFYLLNPDYWFHPLSRSHEFIKQSLERRYWTPISVLFNGIIYNYRGPFYYPFVMFIITTPLFHLILLSIGIMLLVGKRLPRNDIKLIYILACFISPFIILSLPISPAHDGIRYLLPAFPFAVCFMAFALEKLWDFIKKPSCSNPIKISLKYLLSAIFLILFAFDLHSPARIPPFELSYYNRIIGGVTGAFKRGFEMTYWCEIFNYTNLQKLNVFCKNSSVYFPISPGEFFFQHLRQLNKIDFKMTHDIGDADFILFFARPNIDYWKNYIWSKQLRQWAKPKLIWVK